MHLCEFRKNRAQNKQQQSCVNFWFRLLCFFGFGFWEEGKDLGETVCFPMSAVAPLPIPFCLSIFSPRGEWEDFAPYVHMHIRPHSGSARPKTRAPSTAYAREAGFHVPLAGVHVFPFMHLFSKHVGHDEMISKLFPHASFHHYVGNSLGSPATV